MIHTKHDIIQVLLSHKEEIRSFKIDRIGLFGSFNNGNNNNESDIDLLVEFEHGKKTFKNYTGAYLFLKDVLQKEIDFLTPEALSPYVGEHILKSIDYVSFNN
jgi:predicted nucleotidyltransferase